MAFVFGGSDTEQRGWRLCFSGWFGAVVAGAGGEDDEATKVEYDEEMANEVCKKRTEIGH